METPYRELAGILGLTRVGGPSLGPVQIMDRVQQGLTVATLYNFSGQIAPGDKQFVFRIVPKASLARRKRAHKPLTAEESNRLARLASVWAIGESVWKDTEATRAFLLRPHPLLEGRKPMEVVLESEFGAELVKAILGRLVYGTAA
jgi:putative toxin-antitoxin system antitoxin component (TIGR02293 family)